MGFYISGRGPGAQVLVSQVVPGSAAEAAGLQAGDALVTLNGQAPPRYLPAWLRQHEPGDTVALRIQRDNQDLDLKLTLGSIDLNKFTLVETPGASEKQKRIRDGWLKGKTD
jgi:S1-C subfamily serine protease